MCVELVMGIRCVYASTYMKMYTCNIHRHIYTNTFSYTYTQEASDSDGDSSDDDSE